MVFVPWAAQLPVPRSKDGSGTRFVPASGKRIDQKLILSGSSQCPNHLVIFGQAGIRIAGMDVKVPVVGDTLVGDDAPRNVRHKQLRPGLADQVHLSTPHRAAVLLAAFEASARID